LREVYKGGVGRGGVGSEYLNKFFDMEDWGGRGGNEEIGEG
jgi:hypothetical protein